MQFQDYWSMYKAALGVNSDNAMAKQLGFSRQHASRVKNEGAATDELCAAMAKAIGVEIAVVLVARNAARDSGEIGDAWKALLGKVAAVVILIGGSWTSPSDAIALELRVSNDTQVIGSANKDYRKYRIRQLFQDVGRFFRALFPVIA